MSDLSCCDALVVDSIGWSELLTDLNSTVVRRMGIELTRLGYGKIKGRMTAWILDIIYIRDDGDIS